MCITLDSLPDLGDCGKNAPGGIAFNIILTDDVDTIPAATAATHSVDTDITLVATKVWHTWYFTPGTLKYTSVSEGEVDGQSYANQVEIFVPKYREEIAGQLNSLAGRNYLIVIEDSNEQPILFGDLKKPMKMLSESLDSGAGGTDRNGSTITFRQMPNATYKPYFYAGALPLV